MTASLEPVLGVDAGAAALRRLAGLVQQQGMVMAFADIFLIVARAFRGDGRPRPAAAQAGRRTAGRRWRPLTGRPPVTPEAHPAPPSLAFRARP